LPLLLILLAVHPSQAVANATQRRLARAGPRLRRRVEDIRVAEHLAIALGAEGKHVLPLGPLDPRDAARRHDVAKTGMGFRHAPDGIEEELSVPGQRPQATERQGRMDATSDINFDDRRIPDGCD
jgi:hypothetical protein